MNRLRLGVLVLGALVSTRAPAIDLPRAATDRASSPRPDRAAPESAATGTAARGGAPASAPASAAAPDQEKLEAAADNVARMKAALKLVLQRAEQARKDKDVVMLNCVNEKLTQIKALVRVAEQADVALHDAVTTRQQTAEAEFSKVAIARTKVDALRRDAEQCIGQLAYVVQDKTTVEVEQPQDLPRSSDGLGVALRGENPADAVSQIGNGPAMTFQPPVLVRPPAASPYR